MEESKVHYKDKEVAKHLAAMIKKEFPDIFFNHVLLFCDKYKIIVKEVDMEKDLESEFSSYEEVFVRILLQSEVDLNIRNREKDTPLHLATRLGNLGVVQMLLDYNVDFQEQNIYGDTPLHIAVRLGNDPIFQILFTLKVDLNILNVDGDTVAHLAVRHDRITMVKKLLPHKDAGFEVINADGETPCHIAFHKGNKVIIDALLHSKISLQVLNRDGETPVHLAVRFDRKSLVQMFLNIAADIHIKNKRGNTLLHHAVFYGRTSMTLMLLHFHIDIDIPDENSETALHLAVRDKNFDNVVMLVAYGANILAKNKKGESVYDIAKHLPIHSEDCYECENNIRCMLVAGFLLKNTNIENNPSFFVPSRFYDEVKKMKEQKVGKSCISIYDIVQMKANVVASYLTEGMLKEAQMYSLTFRGHARVLNFKIDEIKQWYLLRDQTIKHFNKVFHSFVTLPAAAVELILSHFDLYELRKFNYPVFINSVLID